MKNVFNLKPKQRKFTKNERQVLCCLLENCKMPDAKISEKLKITTQAVGKIRRRLEAERVINGYCAKLDMEKVGINLLAVALLKCSCRAWKEKPEDILDGIKKAYSIIGAYRIPRQDVSIILLYGFRGMVEMESYFHSLDSIMEYMEIVDVFPFSPHSIIKMDPNDILKRVITRPEEIAKPIMR